MAPYLPPIHSSGTGKTKLMHEYKMMIDKSEDHDVHCEIILCHDGNAAKVTSTGSIFSKTLDESEIPTNEEGRVRLWRQLNDFAWPKMKNETKKVVLLFDESQHLTGKGDGWHFRSIRWWLRLPRDDGMNVASAFAGTTTSLANYYAEPKESQTSRDAIIEYNEGDKLYPPFYQITTTGLVSCTDGSEFGPVGGISKLPLHANDEKVTEFDVAVQYGRPLFARMHLKGELKGALGKIFLRMKSGARAESQDMQSLQQDYSILATRLQMGQVTFDFASKLVASFVQLGEGWWPLIVLLKIIGNRSNILENPQISHPMLWHVVVSVA